MRVAYWLSSFDPDMEALASEVACLRQAFPRSIAWGVGARTWGSLSWKRGFGVHPRLHWVFRGLAGVCQRGFHINHLFGGLDDWFHLQTVRKRPIVLTLAVRGMQSDPRLLEKVDRFIVEWPEARTELSQLGIEPGRVRLIFPPVDLKRFHTTSPPEGPFTVLFASSPPNAAWLTARGIPLILDAAALRPAMLFRLLWRPWGNSLRAVERELSYRGLSNVEVVVGRFADMSMHYQHAHVTIAPFIERGRCKPAPNSLIESMACGRPVAVTQNVGISELIGEMQAGVVTAPNAESLTEGLDRLQCQWQEYSQRARHAAVKWFSSERFIESYRGLYQELV